MESNHATLLNGSKISKTRAREGGASTTPLFFFEFSVAYFAKQNLNGGVFQSEGAAEAVNQGSLQNGF